MIIPEDELSEYIVIQLKVINKSEYEKNTSLGCWDKLNEISEIKVNINDPISKIQDLFI